MALINGVIDIEAVADADLVIEAVFEEMAIKKEVFGKLDKHRQAGRGAGHQHLLSRHQRDRALPPAARSDVLGMHFFCPANVMKLLRDRARRQDRAGRAGDRARRRAQDRQGAGGGRRLRRLRRQPHAARPLDRGRAPAARRRAAAGGRRGDRRVRLPDGPVRDGRSRRPRHRLAHAQGRAASARKSPTRCARWAASARRPARASIATRTARARRCPIPRSRR